MVRALRFIGLLVVNTLVAGIGTAILEHAVWKAFPAHSVIGILWKEWIFSVTFATLIGFAMWLTWRNSAAKWTWVIPARWFSIGVLSVIASDDAVGRIFGLHTKSVFSKPETRTFFTFTVPLIRATFYSVGAYISSLLYSPRVIASADPWA